ncbi:hypothetical protein O7626_27555 [Micromonospora sp. WMMD1102]|uniref:hypothetical protein n=1 Tax=Micromonospora sp. WMMD1102 TaxID=3016105 RepID=UPI0024155E65|nr:hypothetical protein [Micromonospora sp. WMMD1102]MDG4789637.1 hypothetical protein [Micromonospora sp. WMMD1102]
MAERKKLLLRLDPQVHEAIAKWAADDLRSVNAQIEYALRLALRSAGRAAKPAPAGGPAGSPAEPDGTRPDGSGREGRESDEP